MLNPLALIFGLAVACCLHLTLFKSIEGEAVYLFSHFAAFVLPYFTLGAYFQAKEEQEKNKLKFDELKAEWEKAITEDKYCLEITMSDGQVHYNQTPAYVYERHFSLRHGEWELFFNEADLKTFNPEVDYSGVQIRNSLLSACREERRLGKLELAYVDSPTVSKIITDQVVSTQILKLKEVSHYPDYTSGKVTLSFTSSKGLSVNPVSKLQRLSAS